MDARTAYQVLMDLYKKAQIKEKTDNASMDGTWDNYVVNLDQGAQFVCNIYRSKSMRLCYFTVHLAGQDVKVYEDFLDPNTKAAREQLGDFINKHR